MNSHGAAPNPDLFKRWLLGSGWTQATQGALGGLFRYEDALVAVPDEFSDDLVVARGVAERVAEAMSLSVAEVWQRLGSPLMDRIELRLIGDGLSEGRVPLGAASEALKNARRMLSSSGTSVYGPVRRIGRRYRSEAQKVARDAHLAHTEDGSFIFPVYVSLAPSDEVDVPIEETASVVIEPYERKVTRTLATALSTAVHLTQESIEHLSDSALDDASAFGVTREFCQSMAEMVKSPAIERIEVRFDWSQAFNTTEALPEFVTVDRSTRPQLRRLVKRLGQGAEIDSTRYTGTILEIGHGPDQQDHFFVLDAWVRARRTTLRVYLTPEQHYKAVAWYRDQAAVVVKGVARETHAGFQLATPDVLQAYVSDPLEHPSGPTLLS